MKDFLETLTGLINLSPGQLAAGGVLAGIVWKFLERVGGVLQDDIKLEIAIWLLGIRAADKIKDWPDTFAAVLGCLARNI